MSDRYRCSEEWHERALRTIPLGTQTFSKSKTQLPFGVSPYFAARGRGGHLIDVDGNAYVDLSMSLCAVTLGYADPDVDAAVRAQLGDGVILSLPHTLEVEVAELVCGIVPCAEMVRFGKNGSDATSGAVRVARAFTGRDHVLSCGYHGWQDWYIGATARNAGVPESVRGLTRMFPYGDLAALDALFRELPGDVACVIMEPMNAVEPPEGYLAGVLELCRANGALLVFDETITGFRYANGGAQELFGVTPDLATFGKGMANGYPLSAVCGRADVMRLFEEVFFSFTFGGETLSLAAAKATMDKMRREPVCARLAETGTSIVNGTRERIERRGCGSFLSVSGHPAWTFLNIAEAPGCPAIEIKTLLEQEMFARGVYTLGTHSVCYAHTPEDVAQLLGAYDEVLRLMAAAVEAGDVRPSLRCEPLEPLFKVR